MQIISFKTKTKTGGGGGVGIFRLIENTQLIDFSRRLKRRTRKIGPDWNVSGTRDFQCFCQFCKAFLERRKPANRFEPPNSLCDSAEAVNDRTGIEPPLSSLTLRLAKHCFGACTFVEWAGLHSLSDSKRFVRRRDHT